MPPELADHPFHIHDYSPFIIELGDGVGLRWYGMAYLAGLILGWWWQKRSAAKGQLPLLATEVGDYVMAIAIGMIAGGRLGYCLFYQPDLFWHFDGSLPFWGVLKLHEGGMASHGGIIGFFCASWWFARKRGYSLLGMCDVVAAVCGLGVMFGRLANFINGELWGRPTDGSWGWQFPGEVRIPQSIIEHSPQWYLYIAQAATPRHPSQLYAALSEGLAILLVGLLLQGRHTRPGFTSGAVLTTYSIGRFLNEFSENPTHNLSYPMEVLNCFWGCSVVAKCSPFPCS